MDMTANSMTGSGNPDKHDFDFYVSPMFYDVVET